MQPKLQRPSSARAGLLVGLSALLVTVLACSQVTLRQGWNGARGPVVPHDTFPGDCSLCHETGGWNELHADFDFDHERETGVALVGAHAEAECLRCHNDRGPVTAFLNRGCTGCHSDRHNGRLGRECKSCHGQEDWRPTGQIAEHSKTRFPLVGVHAITACHRCHDGAQVGNFKGADLECHTCHINDARAVPNPDHIALGYTQDCQSCHSPTGWSGANFAHNQQAFPLFGAHSGLQCTQCHVGNRFKGTPTDCFGCHAANYNATTNPNHSQSGYPTTCETCHTATAWANAVFNHTFPNNSGPHRRQCLECHLASPPSKLNYDCTRCHAHNKTSMDNKHKNINGYAWIATTCFGCHPNGKKP